MTYGMFYDIMFGSLYIDGQHHEAGHILVNYLMKQPLYIEQNNKQLQRNRCPSATVLRTCMEQSTCLHLGEANLY
jgi:hypothetical protein